MTDTTPKKKTNLLTPLFVLSYPSLFTPRKNDMSGDMEYTLTGIFDPSKFGDMDKKAWVALNNAICKAIADFQWPKGVKIAMSTAKTANARRLEMEAELRKKFPKANFGLRDGNEYEDKPGYGDGKFFARMKTSNSGGAPRPPGVVDLSGKRVHPDEGNASEIYPGAICRASVNVFCYPDPSKSDMGGRGYSIALNNVQKIKDGPRLDSFTSAEDDFGNAEVDDAWLEGVETEGADGADEFE